jgi:hypothetical protein
LGAALTVADSRPHIDRSTAREAVRAVRAGNPARSSGPESQPMCRSIQPLHNYDPPVTADEVRAAALQYVRKVSGMRRPARANEAAFERAVEAVETATDELLRGLVVLGPPHDRAVERARARARREEREGHEGPVAGV